MSKNAQRSASYWPCFKKERYISNDTQMKTDQQWCSLVPYRNDATGKGGMQMSWVVMKTEGDS